MVLTLLSILLGVVFIIYCIVSYSHSSYWLTLSGLSSKLNIRQMDPSIFVILRRVAVVESSGGAARNNAWK